MAEHPELIRKHGVGKVVRAWRSAWLAAPDGMDHGDAAMFVFRQTGHPDGNRAVFIVAPTPGPHQEAFGKARPADPRDLPESLFKAAFPDSVTLSNVVGESQGLALERNQPVCQQRACEA